MFVFLFALLCLQHDNKLCSFKHLWESNYCARGDKEIDWFGRQKDEEEKWGKHMGGRKVGEL